MSKPVLYVFGGSVWSAAAELAVAELFPEGAIELQTVNLMQGDNFSPAFIKKNPNATIPTLEAEGEIYTSTAQVTTYLVKTAPKSVKPGNAQLIETIHEDKYDPNFSLLLARNHEELKAKSDLALAFLGGRQSALELHSTSREAEAFKEFYQGKIASNGGLLAIYAGKAPDAHKNGFFGQSQSHFDTIAAFFNDTLPSYLPNNGFIGGSTPGEDDFHVGAWLTRIAASVGAKTKEDVLGTLEKAFGKQVPPTVQSYWQAWSERPSWNKVYGNAIH